MSLANSITSRHNINRLFMALILAAARGDRDKVFEIARRIVEELERDLLGEGEAPRTHGGGSR